MDAFLVVGKEQCLEASMGLFADHDVAISFAEDATEDDVRDAILTERGGNATSFDLYPLEIGIVEFREGEPGPYETVKEFADVTTIDEGGLE